MSIAPFSTRPVSFQSERRRTRLAMAIATLGIAATLFAYSVSPGVRHAVSHAAHSVHHAMSRVLDRDAGGKAHANKPSLGKPAAPSRRSKVTHPSSSPR